METEENKNSNEEEYIQINDENVNDNSSYYSRVSNTNASSVASYDANQADSNDNHPDPADDLSNGRNGNEPNQFLPIDPSPLESYEKDLNTITINELMTNRLEQISEIRDKMAKWFDWNLDYSVHIKFDIANPAKLKLPRDIFIIELREKNDLYDSYLGAYQSLLKYNKDIIDRDSAPIGKIAIQLDWYKKACYSLLKAPESFDTLTVDYDYTISNSLNNEKYSNSTRFLLFYYPVGLFETNNILPTQVWNRLILRYRFLDTPICFIPSITKSFSNTDEFAVAVNEEFNRLLYGIIKFTERDHDKITANGKLLESYSVTSTLKHKPYKIDMRLKVRGTKIKIFNYKLLPTISQFNTYYNPSPSPILIDVIKYTDVIKNLKSKYGGLLEEYGLRKSLFEDSLVSLYKPTDFNIAIIWWFLSMESDSTKLMFSLRENITRLFSPQNALEKLYYLSKIKIVSEKKILSEFKQTGERATNLFYSFNELIHLVHAFIMTKEGHFYFKYQHYNDISSDSKTQKKKANPAEENAVKIQPLDDLELKFVNEGVVYETSLKELNDNGYLTLDFLFSLERTVNFRLFYDQNEYVNYLYYFNGLLQNRYQNRNTLIATASNLLNSYNNDMRTLYIIGESQCGKSVFKNILLQYINEYYEKTSTKPSEFNYDDSAILKVYDDVDLLEKSSKQKTYLILNKDSLTVNINEKNKQPVKVYKDITNIVLNNDWPLITTWYHQRRIKTCLFIPISKKSLTYTVERIFKSETRGNGSFNDVFINNFFQYLLTYKDDLFYDGVYYSDCFHLLDADLPYEIVAENVKNILNLNSVSNSKRFINVVAKKCITILKQQPNQTYIDYYARKKFNLSFYFLFLSPLKWFS